MAVGEAGGSSAARPKSKDVLFSRKSGLTGNFAFPTGVIGVTGVTGVTGMAAIGVVDPASIGECGMVLVDGSELTALIIIFFYMLSYA